MDKSEMLMKLEETAALLIAAAAHARHRTDADDAQVASALSHVLKALDLLENAAEGELRELIESEAGERAELERHLDEQFSSDQ